MNILSSFVQQKKKRKEKRRYNSLKHNSLLYFFFFNINHYRGYINGIRGFLPTKTYSATLRVGKKKQNKDTEIGGYENSVILVFIQIHFNMKDLAHLLFLIREEPKIKTKHSNAYDNDTRP